MCNGSAANDDGTISTNGLGNGIIASSRSCAVTVATITFTAISAANSAGTTGSAAAPGDRPISAN